ncbi:uncharacterized protein LOC106668519 isoform X2 [Cimex lectularius]|nr:uncharacterized protein LOC106668519 isoform X2 [Cimex lectularius]
MGSVPQVSVLKGPVVGNVDKPRLHKLFSANAAKHPEKTALICEEDGKHPTKSLSYGEVEERSNRLARALLLATKDKSPNDDGDRVIGLCMEPSPELIIAILAVWKSGCSYLTFAPNAPVNRTRHIVQEARPVLVVTDKSGTGDLYAPTECVEFSGLEAVSADLSESTLEEDESYPTKQDAIIIILYTSGSTGISKGVRLRNSSTLNRLRWQWRVVPFAETEDHSVFKTSLTFVDSVCEIWAPLLEPTRGRTLVVIPSATTTNPQKLVALLNKYKVERFLLVPSLLKSILLYLGLSKENAKLLDSVKTWVCSGETLSVPLALEFFDNFPSGNQSLYNFYGSTEIMGDVTYHKMSSFEEVSINGKVPIGIPLDNTIIYLLDESMKVVDVGQMGELYVAGTHLADGYVNKRDTYRFVDNPNTVDPAYKTVYKTGDFGRVVKGTLVFEGRTDSQIKVRGNRVDLAEVETALNKISGVQKGVVLCHRLGESGQQIVAFVLLETESKLDQKTIEEELLKSVAEYAKPQVLIIKKMPYLVNGKVDRQSLLALYREVESAHSIEANINFDYSFVPKDKMDAAECLFSTVAEVLGHLARGNISCKTNFYELGGNSLNSVVTISKLKENGFFISITDFITADNLGIVIRKMYKKEEKENFQNGSQSLNKYTLRILEEKDKEIVIGIVADSFYRKSDIETHMVPPVKRAEYIALLEAVWPYLVKHRVSIVALNDSEEIMGASLVFQMDDEPGEIDLHCQIQYVLEFLDYVEVPIRDTMLPKSKVLHSFMLGTDQRLTPQENVEITEILESYIVQMGKERGFVGVFTTNTSPLTQQLAVINGFQPLNKYQINQYVAPDGTRPFKNVPDDGFAICAWKPF